jgi:hypothetical protein
MEFTREQLYKEIWYNPITSLEKKYNVRGSDIRKVCSQLEVPLPQSGYWQKIKHNKSVSKIPLPKLCNTTLRVVTINSKSDVHAVKRIPSEAVDGQAVNKENKNTITVPRILTNPEKIINTTKRYYAAYNKRKWDSPELSLPHLNLNVSDQQLPRALLFMDTLIKEIRRRGYEFLANGQTTAIVINEQNISFALRERRSVKKRSLRSWERTNEPTGKLIFKIEDSYWSKEWADGGKQIEEKLEEIISGLESKSEEQRLEKIESEKRQKEYSRKKSDRLEFEDRRKRDLLSFKEALNNADRWHKTTNLRNFIKEVESRARKNNNYTEELKSYLKRLREQADWFDPFINSDDELLKEVDRNMLEIPKSQYHW